jgi:response regulator RpfG family c-di-GMP phosphodiesterase
MFYVTTRSFYTFPWVYAVMVTADSHRASKLYMERPCFIVVDREFPRSIATRKLVIETAKFNVITAYDGAEALECLRHFPKVDGVVVNADMTDDEECRTLIDDLRRIVPNLECNCHLRWSTCTPRPSRAHCGQRQS